MPLGEPEVDDELPPAPPPQPVELREPQLLRDEPSRYAGGVGGRGVADLPPGEPVLPPVYNGETTGTTAEPVLLQDAQDMVLRDRTCSGEYICHTSEIQTGWSPRSERPFQR